MAPCPRILHPTVLAILVACGGGSDPGPDAPPPVPTVSRIEIRPGSQVLTPDRRTAPLTAIAFDANGAEMAAAFTWHSSRPEQITVDANGVVTGVVALGSAAVWAETTTARSAPALIASVELHPGTLAVLDAQVVQLGTPVTPDGGPFAGTWEVDLRLRDVGVPAVGTVIVPLESQPVGGVVLSAVAEGGEVAVRLRSAPLPELFAAYTFDWELGLEDYAIVMDDAELPPSAMARLPFEQTLERNFPSSGMSAFQCTTQITAYLDKNLVDLKLVGGAKFVYKSANNDPALPNGYLKMAIEGPLTVKGSIGLKLRAGFRASAKCELRGHIPIYLGAFSFLVYPEIPLGVGVDINADVNVATLEIGFEGENGFDLSLGFVCPGGAMPCVGLTDASWINKFKPLMETPSGMNDLKTTLAGKAYFLTGLDFLFLASYEFKAVKATFGPLQKATFATVRQQANERSYASEYTLDIEGKLEPGEGFDNLVKAYLGDDTQNARLGAELVFTDEISKSPRGTIAVNKTSTGVDSPVRVTFTLSEQDYFLLGYNIDAIVLYKKHADDPLYEYVDQVMPTMPGQTTFTLDWTPDQDDVGTNELYAFTKTKLPVFELELGNDVSRKVEVVELCGGGSTLAGGPDGGCQITGNMSWTMVTTTPIGMTTTTASANVTMQQDSTQPGIVFRPYGTWTSTHGGNIGDCTISVSPNPATGTMTGDPSQGVINLTPDLYYDGHIATGPFPVVTTMACPGSPPIIQPQDYDFLVFKVFDSENLMLDPITMHATGSYQETGGDGMGSTQVQTWTWDLALTPDMPPP